MVVTLPTDVGRRMKLAAVQAGSTLSAYVVDMYSKLEDETLERLCEGQKNEWHHVGYKSCKTLVDSNGLEYSLFVWNRETCFEVGVANGNGGYTDAGKYKSRGIAMCIAEGIALGTHAIRWNADGSFETFTPQHAPPPLVDPPAHLGSTLAPELQRIEVPND